MSPGQPGARLATGPGAAPRVRAELLEQGVPALWQESMDELRRFKAWERGPGSQAVPGRRHGLIAGTRSARRSFACLRSIPKYIAEPVERGHGQPVASVTPEDWTHADMDI
jgi:hypothetical protein